MTYPCHLGVGVRKTANEGTAERLVTIFVSGALSSGEVIGSRTWRRRDVAYGSGRVLTSEGANRPTRPVRQYPPLRRLSGSPAILPACLEGLPG
jgi:hypothetical protein